MQQYSGPTPPQPYGDFRVIGGYDQILKPLASGIPIRLSSPVHEIEYSKNGAEIHTSKGFFKAKVVVMAVPGGVLKAGNIKFNSPLPAARTQALARTSISRSTREFLSSSAPLFRRVSGSIRSGMSRQSSRKIRAQCGALPKEPRALRVSSL